MRPTYGPLRDALFKKRRAPRLEEYEPLRDQYLDYAAGDFWQAAVALGRDLVREDEPYNGGKAFKIACRDMRGVMVTIIADNYFGYCKKEVKTQISYSANLFGLCEEEHGDVVGSKADRTENRNLFCAFVNAGDHRIENEHGSDCELNQN